VSSEKITAPGNKLFCVVEYHTRKSVVTVQRAFRTKVIIFVFVPPFLRELADLKLWIIAAVKHIDVPRLTRV
jgi:hypothetical protein